MHNTIECIKVLIHDRVRLTRIDIRFEYIREMCIATGSVKQECNKEHTSQASRETEEHGHVPWQTHRVEPFGMKRPDTSHLLCNKCIEWRNNQQPYANTDKDTL